MNDKLSNQEINPHPGGNESEPGLKVAVERQCLIIEGAIMTLDDPPEAIRYALNYNWSILNQGVEDYKQSLGKLEHLKGAIIERAPLIAMRLGTATQALSKSGLEGGNYIKTSPNALKEKFHAYWQAIESAGYQPEARAYNKGKWGTEVTLFFYVPEIDPSAGEK